MYRKSRDTDRAVVFHHKCDKYKGTLIVVKTFENIKFGGYTTESWDGNNVCKKDNKAFIFYLNDLRAYNIKENLDAIYCSPQYGPFFCGKNNFTFKLFNNCEINGGQCCKAEESHYDGYLHVL